MYGLGLALLDMSSEITRFIIIRTHTIRSSLDKTTFQKIIVFLAKKNNFVLKEKKRLKMISCIRF